MATKFADRGFISINGAPIADVKNIEVRRNPTARAVPTMTRNGRNKGYVQGNLEIQVNFAIAIENLLARPKIEAIDYENNDVALTFEVGADQFVCVGLFPGDYADRTPGVGQEAETTFTLGALDVVDSFGNSALFQLGL